MDTGRCGKFIMFEWQVWRPAYHGLICCGHILCTYHSRDLCAPQKETWYGTAIQGFWISCITSHLYFAGYSFLYRSCCHIHEVFIMGTGNCIAGGSFILFCCFPEKTIL